MMGSNFVTVVILLCTHARRRAYASREKSVHNQDVPFHLGAVERAITFRFVPSCNDRRSTMFVCGFVKHPLVLLSDRKLAIVTNGHPGIEISHNK